ncbi:MAG: hypothetical protein H3C39_06805 [Flavobacteriia bacterium]|nr:hypothetical protein [Flavobacteriia bacterium]
MKVDSFDYFRNWQAEKSYLVIYPNIQNAVWHRIGKFKSARVNRPILIDLQNVKSDLIIYEVFGLFQKKRIEIKISKELKSDLIKKTELTDRLQIELKKKSLVLGKSLENTLQIPDFELIHEEHSVAIPDFSLNLNEINPNIQNIKIEFKPFKLEDHI